MKNILIISTSLRKGGNSDLIAEAFAKGAIKSGNTVEKVNLSEREIKYCIGCLNCQRTGLCPIKDDMAIILEKMKKSDVIVFATPIYFYEMCGQMKTLLDRTNPLYNTDYKFRDIYLLASAAEDEKSAMEGAIRGLQGWVECFPNTQLKGVIYGTGLVDYSDINKHLSILQEATDMGSSIS